VSIKIRRANERGFANHGWLKSYHTFSFGDYHDPDYMGFRSLRVINEDSVAAAEGFGSHPHQDMEIITYVLKGSLAHKDSMGNQKNINAGDIQKMTAGSGVIHSEFNADSKNAVHFFQIWILPNKRGLAPSYQQTTIQKSFQQGLLLILSDRTSSDALLIQQDAQVFLGRFKAGEVHSYNIKPKRGIWFQMITGRLRVDSLELNDSDAIAVEHESVLSIQILKDSEFLLFDLV